MDLVDRVGRQRCAVSPLVPAARGLQFSVVPPDSGGGQVVEPDVAERRDDVVADDLLVAQHRRGFEPQGRTPRRGEAAETWHPPLEALVLGSLLQRSGVMIACGEIGFCV